MKNKVYYWIAIVVLLLSNAFFVVYAQIQSGYAKEAMFVGNQNVKMALEQKAKAERQAEIEKVNALAAQAEAIRSQQALADCKGGK